LLHDAMVSCKVVSTCVADLTESLICASHFEAVLQAAPGSSAAVWGSEHAEDVALDEAKLREALKKQKAHNRKAIETDDRKRKFNSLAGNEEVTPEEMEAYRMSRNREDDPMAKYLEAGD